MSELHITMLGTGSPRPNLERCPSSQVLFIDNLPILIDCGEGATQQLMKAGVELEKVNYLWLTHLHSDHVLGYGQFLIGGWAAGRRQLTVFGPKGTKKFHYQMMEMFEKDITYRISLGRPEKGLLDVQVVEVEQPGEVPSDLPAKITAESMVHNVPTFAYRFDVDHHAVVFSGDTAPTDKLVKLATGADILIHDSCLAVPVKHRSQGYETVFKNLKKEHCSPAQAAVHAQRAGVKKLVLTHFLVGIDTNEVFREASERFSGTVIVPDDLDVISAE